MMLRLSRLGRALSDMVWNTGDLERNATTYENMGQTIGIGSASGQSEHLDQVALAVFRHRLTRKRRIPRGRMPSPLASSD